MGTIRLRGVGKTFPDGTVAVKDVDLDIDDGEIVVFVGPSGCGKTTLLRMIAGLEPISSGEIFLGDEIINDISPRDRDIAMVFQNYALYPHMSVRQNIAFALKLRKFSKSEIDKRVNEAARILDLSELLERKPRQLSGGQRQRVAMGRAIVRHPAAFLLDEPLSNLDAKLRVQLRAELGRLHARLGVTTVHVTHDQIEAMTLGDRIAVFSKGKLQQYDKPEVLYHHPANVFVAGFIGSPAMNFLVATPAEDGAANMMSIGSSTIKLGPLAGENNIAAGEKIIVGIRPEHLAWRPADENTTTHLRARVELVERLEPESFVAVSLTDPAAQVHAGDKEISGGANAEEELAKQDTNLLMMRMPAQTVPNRGDIIELVIDVGQTQLFNFATGTALFRDRSALAKSLQTD